MKNANLKQTAIAIIVLFVATIAIADTHVGGRISTDTIWDIGGSPYIADSTVTVRGGARLRIDPGVTVMFAENAGLIIGPDESWCNGHGEMEALGMDVMPITFCGIEDTTESWKGIMFAGDADCGYSQMDYCIIENAGVENEYGESANLFFQNVDATHITLDHITVRNSSGYSIYSQNSGFSMNNTVVEGLGSSRMVFLDNSSPSFSNCTFTANGAFYWLYSQNAECEPTITNCVFNGTTIMSLRLGTEFVMSGNSYSGATYLGTEVIGGDINSDRTWEKQIGDSIYTVVTSDLRVHNHATLTLMPGTHLKFSSGTGLVIGPDESSSSGEGALIADGDSLNNIVFSGKSTSSLSWKGIAFGNDADCGSLRSSLSYCIIRNAGQTNYLGEQANVYSDRNITPAISNCVIEMDSVGGHALLLDQSSITVENSEIQNMGSLPVVKLINCSPNFNNTRFIGNGASYWIKSEDLNCAPMINSCVFSGEVEKPVRVGPEFQMTGNTFTGSFTPGLEVFGGNLSNNRTWEKQVGDSSYVIINNDFKIRGNAVLTIEPGVFLKFSASTGMIIGYDESWCNGAGSILANGNELDNIVFTGVSPTAGSWKGLLFDADSDCPGMIPSLSYCVIENAGVANYRGINAAVHCYGTNSVHISDCEITNSSGHGIYLESSQLADTLCGNSITSNALGGIYLSSDCFLALSTDPDSSNILADNGSFSIENRSAYDIPASYNYWGTMDSLEIEESIYDSVDNPSYGRVQFMPWEILYPLIGIEPTVYNFDSIEVGDTTSLSVWIKNTGAGTLEIDTCFTTSSEFPIIASSLIPMAPGDSSFLGIVFVPEEEGACDETLWVYSEFDTAFVRLIGYGLPEPHSMIGVEPLTHNFDSTTVGDTASLTIWIRNIGVGILEIDTCFTTSSEFPIIYSLLIPMGSEDSSSIGLQFIPDEMRAYDETLWVFSEFDTAFTRLIGYGASGIGEFSKPENHHLWIEPNPFNSAVSIISPANARVEIFDLNGRSVANLPGGEQVWKPEPSVGSGIYLVRATVGEQEITKRVVYLK